MFAVATANRTSLAHDLVTIPDQLELSPRSQATQPSLAEPESTPRLAERVPRASALLLNLRSGLGLPLGEARTFATSRGAVDVALGYLSGSSRYAGVTAGLSQIDSRISGFRETTFQFGVDLAYRAPLPGRIEPWLGLGFAWQILWLTQRDFYMKAFGPQFPIVRVGVDYRLGDHFAIGPFAAFAYRRYDPYSVEGQTPVELSKIDRRDGWILLGVSASFWAARL
jgi:hypothetical protein